MKTTRAYLGSSFPKSLLRIFGPLEKNLKAGIGNLELNFQDENKGNKSSIANTHIKTKNSNNNKATKNVQFI